MRKRKFNLEENLYEIVLNSEDKRFPSIEGGHLWDFREIESSFLYKVRSQGIKKPFPIPSCEKELQRFYQVTELRNLFQTEVSTLEIEPPKECINRWLFNQLAIPRSDDQITVFVQNPNVDQDDQKEKTISSTEPLFRNPKEESEVLRTQLIETLPGPMIIPHNYRENQDYLREVYGKYIQQGLKWLTKWNPTKEIKDLLTAEKILLDLKNRIEIANELIEFERIKDEVLTICESTTFSERFSIEIQPILDKIVKRAEELSDEINKKQINSNDEIITIKEGDNNKKYLTYKESEMFVSGLHYLKLFELFKINSGLTLSEEENDKEEFLNSFHKALYVLVRRYATFFGDNEGDGFHAAAPESSFEVMHDCLGVVQELFASPFNCHFGKFCSAFPDIDCWFGSCGSFFDFIPQSGSFEVGPPYVTSVMDQMAIKLEKILQKSTEPLSFIIYVPEWKDPIADYHKIIEASEYLKLSFVMGGNDHAYVVGDQHVSDTRYVKLPFRTSVYIMQNSLGSNKWPIYKGLQNELEESLRGPIEMKKKSNPRGRLPNPDSKKSKKRGRGKQFKDPPSKRRRRK